MPCQGPLCSCQPGWRTACSGSASAVPAVTWLSGGTPVLRQPSAPAGWGGQPLVYMRLNGTTSPQALLNPPIIVQGYITASGGRCALYRCAVCRRICDAESSAAARCGWCPVHCICCSRVRLVADGCTAPCTCEAGSLRLLIIGLVMTPAFVPHAGRLYTLLTAGRSRR